MEKNICVNCQHEIEINFCTNCGQKKYARIDRKYIVDEFKYSVLHVNKGFFYTLKSVIKNPGKTAREFIDGKRAHHYKPILFAFVLAGISTYISYKVLRLDKIIENIFANNTNANNQLMNDYMKFIISNNSALLLGAIPIISLFTWLVFKKWGNNYFEHIIMNSFFQGFYIIISALITYIPFYFFPDNEIIIFLLSFFSIIIILFSLGWFYSNFYLEKSLGDIIIKLVILIGVFFFMYIMTIIIATIVVLIMSRYDPEIIKYFQPVKH